MSHKPNVPDLDETWKLVRETQKNLKDISAGQKVAEKERRELRAGQKELQANQKVAEKERREWRAGQKEFQAGQKEFQANQKVAEKERREWRAGQKEFQAGQKEFQANQKVAEKERREWRVRQEKLQASQEETSRQMDRTDIRINKIVGDFGNRWGKLGENLVKGSLVQRLRERGIEVEKVLTNAKLGDLEFDIIAINGREVVVVEVKATLDPSDVEEFTENIEKFKIHWPEFKGKTLYGAMAFLIRANKKAGDMAQKKGFFVIEATGDVIIQNKKDFEPKVFS